MAQSSSCGSWPKGGDQEQLEFLRTLKCDGMQGYLFSRPVPPVEFAALLERGVILPDGVSEAVS